MFRRINHGDNNSSAYGSSGYGNSHGGRAQQWGAAQQTRQPQAGVTQRTDRLSNALRQAQLAQEQRFQQSQQPQQQQQTRAGTGRTANPQPEQKQKYFDPSVQFEPLNEDMLKLLGKAAPSESTPQSQNMPLPQSQNASLPQDTPLPQSLPPAESLARPAPQEIPQELFKNPYLTKTDISADKIAGLIQDEHNGAAFYRLLCERFNNGRAKELFESIAAENDKRVAVLGNMYYDTAGKHFMPVAPNVEFSADLKTSLKAAAAEENTVIEKIIDMLEHEQNPKLQQMFYRKLNYVNKMLEMLV